MAVRHDLMSDRRTLNHGVEIGHTLLRPDHLFDGDKAPLDPEASRALWQSAQKTNELSKVHSVRQQCITIFH